MRLSLNDYVTVNIGQKKLYGKIVEFTNRASFIKVDLLEPYQGERKIEVPSYFADSITEHEYWHESNKVTKSKYSLKDACSSMMACDHNWIKSGQGMNMKANEFWWNCKNCGIAKEDA